MSSMSSALNDGLSGLTAFDTEMNAISNNIANANTVGFKSSSVNFQEVLATTIQSASGPSTNGLGGTNPEQLGLGVTVGSIDTNESQGTLTATGNGNDCAIQGTGYFVLNNGQSTSYTRDGTFSLDANNNLVTSSGLEVQGWTANASGNIGSTATATLGAIQIPVGQLSIAQQTGNVQYNGNLNVSVAAGQSQTVSSSVYDSLGQAHTVSVTFTKMGEDDSQTYPNTRTSTLGTGTLSIQVGSNPAQTVALNGPPASGSDPAQNNTLQGAADAINAAGIGVTAAVVNTGTVASPAYMLQLSSSQGAVTVDTSGLTAGTGTIPTFTTATNPGWSWTATSPDESTTSSVGGGIATFNASGNCTSGPLALTLNLSSPNGAVGSIPISATMSQVTATSGTPDVSASSQDGFPTGTLSGYSIGTSGIITGSFTNGMTKTIGQVALASFANPAGLNQDGSNLLTPTGNSGLAQVGQPNAGGLGTIQSGYLEASNVDLATEFTNMIVAQRSFQANSRIVTTVDQMLQELMQMKQ